MLSIDPWRLRAMPADLRAKYLPEEWPESIEVVEEFPRTVSGKVKKYERRDAMRKRATNA